MNKQSWIKYQLPDILFVKKFEYLENALYPDMNSNTEIYTAGDFIEIESLSPIERLTPNASTEHTEFWQLSKN